MPLSKSVSYLLFPTSRWRQIISCGSLGPWVCVRYQHMRHHKFSFLTSFFFCVRLTLLSLHTFAYSGVLARRNRERKFRIKVRNKDSEKFFFFTLCLSLTAWFFISAPTFWSPGRVPTYRPDTGLSYSLAYPSPVHLPLRYFISVFSLEKVRSYLSTVLFFWDLPIALIGSCIPQRIVCYPLFLLSLFCLNPYVTAEKRSCFLLSFSQEPRGRSRFLLPCSTMAKPSLFLQQNL